ncbi:MAG: hypothetical protein FWE16_04020 [Firmicutes bacterium]|nr:hypothetical protein [Bacillota bacterium]
MEDLSCNKCGSHENVKNGIKHGKQNYLCRSCGCQYTTDNSGTEREKSAAITLYCAGFSLRKVGNLLHYSHITILNWVKDFANKPLPGKEILLSLGELKDVVKTKLGIGSGKKINDIEDAIKLNADKAIDKLISEAFV